MNQILCGDTVIDTDDIQLAIKIEGDDAQRRVFLRGGKTAILRGEEEAAFDVWAATLPRAGGDGIDTEQIIDHGEPTTANRPWPPDSGLWSKCGTCRDYCPGTRVCAKGYPVSGYPECHVAREEEAQLSNPKPLCATCACYEAESGHCTEFAGNHYSECWVEREEAADCKLCRHYRSCEYCMRGKEREWSGCFETREAEAKPPEKAKVLLLSRIWECNKCGEVLAIDITTGEPADVSQDEVHIDGEVKIRIDGVPLVRCPNCQTVSEWPAELRERVVEETRKEKADDRTG